MSAAKLSSKAQVDTLKQRELEYQGDLRGKDRIIDEKSNQIIEITKELQEKDAEIKFLKASNAKLEEARVAHLTLCEEKDAEIKWLKEKLLESVKNIYWMSEKMLARFD